MPNQARSPAIGQGESMSYRIVLAHSDREELAHALNKAISQALADSRITADQLEIAIELSKDGVNQAVAYLASEEGRVDLKVNAMIQEALNVNVPIIPIVMKDEESTIPEKLPASLSHHNAAFWQDDGASVALTLLRTIGLTESQRKVFISYRRSETSDLADQLHTALVQRGFDVFLDRFSIHAGDYFPRRIDENLADKTFLLLLESNGLQESPWVQYEINFAIENHLGLTALNLPDCVNNMSEINETIRFRLTHDNLTKEGTLTPQALARYLQHIESAHARALRRRRLRLLGSTMDRLHAKGYSCQQVGE